MGDLLSTATSGLLAFQRGLDTTGHNIANVNTEGYSRQRVQIGTRTPEPFSNGWLGNGADVKTIERLYSDMLAAQTRTTSSSLSRFDTYVNNANSLDSLLGDAKTGLSASMQSFIDSFNDMASSPSSIPARQVVLSQAESFSERLRLFDNRLAQIDRGIDSEITSEANTISSLAKQIAALNQRIEIGQNSTGQPPNDLLDQRDHLIDELSTHVSVAVAKQDNGQVLVSIGNGQSLVVGSIAANITPITDPYDPTRSGIAIQGIGPAVDVTTRLTGGKLGGLLDFRRELLTPTRNDLGRLAVGMAEVVNAQHRDGIDLNGNFGGDLIAVGAPEVMIRNTNQGTGSASVTRTSAGALTGDDYFLESDGAVWTLRRAATGATVTMSGAGTALSPFQAEGMSIVVSGTPQSGDSLLIRPTRAAVDRFDVLVTDPSELAAAAPIIAAAVPANTGTGKVSAGEVLTVGNAALQTPAVILFTSATTYTINGGAAQAYTAGDNVDFNGWRVQITGTPNTGDSFTVGPTTNPAGDNRNGLKLTEALTRPVLNGGTTRLHEGAGRIVSDIGVATGQARTLRAAAESLHEFNVNAQDQLSGVNLDEEAANLVRLQQAYQAAAQAISIADRMFQAVLDATRR
jgi:flagellar hook-associated protein 1 FlgK